jgi:hypothetical protein
MATLGSKAILRVLEPMENVLIPVTDLSDTGHAAAIGLERGAVEVSTFGNLSKKFLAGLKEGSVEYAGLFTNAVSDLFRRWMDYEGPYEFEYYPAGWEQGAPFFYGDVILYEWNADTDVESVGALYASFQMSGDSGRQLSLLDGLLDNNEFIDGNDLVGTVDGNLP